jgi:putative membrane protein
VHVGVMVAWHLPWLYDAAVADDLVHLAEHASFVVTAATFWWLVLAARRGGPSPAAVLLVFAEAMAAAALGVAMVVARTPWYPTFAARQGTEALVDQQVAGAIMWGYGGGAALVVGAGAFAAWLASGEPSGPTSTSTGVGDPAPPPAGVGAGPSVRASSS